MRRIHPRTRLLFSLLSLILSARPLRAQDYAPSIGSVLTGYAAFGYASGLGGDFEHDFTASASLVPLFRIEEDVLVAGEVEFALHDGETLVQLEHAEVHYLGFDRVQLKMGRFHVPFGVWMHNNWINRMPTPPLLYEDTHGEPASSALLPILFDVGVMARWTLPVADGWRTSAALSVTQGPRPGEGDHTHEEMEEEPDEGHSDVARLAYGATYEDNNDDKMLALELKAVSAGGLTLQASGFRAAYDDEGELDVVGVNLSAIWAPRSGPLRLLDVRGEASLLDQEYIDDDETGSVRSGGYYLQVSRRVRDFQPVVRWSHLPQSTAGSGPFVDRRRQLALGLEYWISPSVPLKAAYQWELDGADGFFLQWAVGF
ncbi:MAG: hypothetical protein PVI57_00780 [Gemmatimonadota bacterium]|jgi:hypothetical protein